MAEPFLGEITMFAGNFAPQGWAFCNGQILPISQNEPLYSLLGTTYGGDGRTTFALPDLRGRSPIGFGQGLGLSLIEQGEKYGAENAVLNQQQMPAHTHIAQSAPFNASLTGPISIPAATTGTTQAAPGNTTVLGPIAAGGRAGTLYATTAADTALAPFNATVTGQLTPGNPTIGTAGASQPVGLRNPCLGINFIIALQGIFPAHS